MKDIFSIAQLRDLATQLICPSQMGFIDGGSHDEAAIRENERSFKDYYLLPRVLRGLREIDLSIRMANERLTIPIIIAPTAFQRFVHCDGELGMARAAALNGTCYIVSTLSSTSFQEIASVSEIKPWLQLYLYKERDTSEKLIARAKSAGFGGVVLTVDAPVYGKRYRELQHGIGLQLNADSFPELRAAGIELPQVGSRALASILTELLDPTITWRDVEWLVSCSDMPVVLKGILHPGDAVRALEAGVSGIIMSNHGGRQLSRAPSPLRLLEEVRKSVGDCFPLFVDGGIRCGEDVAIALALGATGVLIGRPAIWGLAAAGWQGVSRVLEIFQDELAKTLLMLGVGSVGDLNPSYILKAY